MKRSISLIAGILIFGASCLRADELKLKDGTKIVGTIVGFEENSFKVKTSYGYAVVDRDQVVSISIADTAKEPDAPKPSGAVKQDTKPPDVKSSDAASKPESAAEKPPSTAPAKTEPAHVFGVQRASAAQPAPQPESNAAPVHASAASSTPAPSSVAANPTPNAPKSNTAALAAANAPAAPVAAPPPKPAVPEPIREEVVGNSYVNETYGFRMYKPPDWEMIAGARTILPGAIAALGNGDQTTYLLIGQDPAGKSLASDMNATEQHLREFMDNFRSLGEKRIAISGNDAIERRFRGTVDEHDWSGTVVLVPRAGKVYTIFGMTYADTDLVQIQENVIARAIASLQFTN
jgi:hypothetical protein